MKTITSICALAVATVGFAAPLAAQSQGDWTFGIGVGMVDPKSDTGQLAGAGSTVDSDVRPTFTVEYFIRDNLGIELLAATPFEHDITIGGDYAGKTKHLPPTLSLNYHFATNSAWKPYVGAGINYTTFFEEESPLGTLVMDDSFGVAVQAGLDYMISDRGAVRMNLRWMDINSDAMLNGNPIGTADLDPIVWNIAYVHRF